MNTSDCQCGRCGREIPEGNAYVSLTRNIEYTGYSIADMEDQIEIFHSDELIRFCAVCGNHFNTELLVKLISVLPADAKDN